MIMLTTISTTCLLYVACALLYQADERRSAFAEVRESPGVRLGMRGGAAALFVTTLLLIAPQQGWERGVPIWLGLFSMVFVLGLFLAAQRQSWHAPSAFALAAVGIFATIGVLL